MKTSDRADIEYVIKYTVPEIQEALRVQRGMIAELQSKVFFPTPQAEAGTRDELLLPEEAAKLAKMELRPFMANVRKRKIPCVRINDRVFRFHWPSVVAALQSK